MQKVTLMALLGLSLTLSACGNDSKPPVTTPAQSEIPDVPRNVNMGAYQCATASTPLSQVLGGPNMLDQGTHVSFLKAQADTPDTLQDMLYNTKSIINNLYYGYSTVNLDQLHQDTYTTFKKSFPNKLNSYILTDNYLGYSNVNAAQQNTIDTLMGSYVDGVKDEHTFYQNVTQTKAYKQGSSPSPVYGVGLAAVPKGDGLLITDTRLNGPANQVGLKRGDVILSVNGVALKRTLDDDDKQYLMFSKVLSDAAKAQQPVPLVVAFAGQARSVSVTPAILSGTNMPWGELRTDAAGKKHYYLRIPTFSSVAPERSAAVQMPIAKRVHELVADAQSKGADDIVVDLRNNGGGLLIEFVGAVAAFAPDKAGEVTRYIDGSSINFFYKGGNVMVTDPCGYSGSLALQGATQWKGKVAVLLNDNSASASEMFSVNMRSAGYPLIGVPTYGVANTSTYHLDLPAGRSMSVTAGRTLIDGKGLDKNITPDVASADDYAKLAASGEDNTLQVAYTTLNK